MLLESTSSLPTAVPESLETSSTASAGSDLPPPSVEPEAIGPRDAVRGRVRDHPRQTVHPLGRRTKAPRSARLEPLVTDLKPTMPSPTPDPASDPTSSHQQLELDLPGTSEPATTNGPATEPESAAETNDDRSEPPSITTNPVTSRRWAMTWKPDADTTERNSQHPAARVTRENIDAATNQPSIPQVQSPPSDADATDPVETLVSEADTGVSTADAAEATTPAPEVASTPVDIAADPEPIVDAIPTPVIESAPAMTEPAESDEPDESDVAPETAAAPVVTTPARPTTDRPPADRTPADQPITAPAGSGAIRVAAAGWIVAVLIGLGWLIASNQPAKQTMSPPATTATVLPAVTPADQPVDTASIMALEAAIVDLEAMAASGAARISALETELEQARSDAAYLGRERSLLQAELEGLMEIIEPPATATTDTAGG